MPILVEGIVYIYIYIYIYISAFKILFQPSHIFLKGIVHHFNVQQKKVIPFDDGNILIIPLKNMGEIMIVTFRKTFKSKYIFFFFYCQTVPSTCILWSTQLHSVTLPLDAASCC